MYIVVPPYPIPARWGMYAMYSTRQHLRIWQLRMSDWDLRKFKNLQVSICAELEQEIGIKNWEVQGGRQVRIWLNTLHPWKIRNCPISPEAASGPQPSCLRSKTVFTRDVFYFILFSPNKISSPLQQACKKKNYNSISSFFSMRMESVGWWVVYCSLLDYLQTLGGENTRD